MNEAVFSLLHRIRVCLKHKKVETGGLSELSLLTPSLSFRMETFPSSSDKHRTQQHINVKWVSSWKVPDLSANSWTEPCRERNQAPPACFLTPIWLLLWLFIFLCSKLFLAFPKRTWREHPVHKDETETFIHTLLPTLTDHEQPSSLENTHSGPGSNRAQQILFSEGDEVVRSCTEPDQAHAGWDYSIIRCRTEHCNKTANSKRQEEKMAHVSV